MTTISKRSKMSYIVLIISVVVLVLSLAVISYAGYRKSLTLNDTISFDKIAINADSKIGASTNAEIYAGAKVTDGDIAFSKASDSRAVYVRAKIRFAYSGGTAEQRAVMEQYLADFNAIDFPIESTAQNGAVWVSNADGFYYLVTSSDHTVAKIVSDTTSYVFCHQIVMPTTLKQYTNDTSLLLPVRLELAIEAVQAEGITGTNFAQVKAVFDETF